MIVVAHQRNLRASPRPDLDSLQRARPRGVRGVVQLVRTWRTTPTASRNFSHFGLAGGLVGGMASGPNGRYLDVLGGIAVALAISLFILIHEAGHFFAARATGMKATEFFLGFGPRVWSFRRGETEFGIRAIPLGGYVRILGMNSLEQVHPDDSERTYRHQPFWKKSTVVLAGVSMNMLLAFLMLFALMWASGEYRPTTTVRTVANDPNHGAPSPAALAGLLPGDTLLAINGVEAADWAHAVSIIHAHPGESITLHIARGVQRLQLTADLAARHPVTHASVGYLGVTSTFRRASIGPGASAISAGEIGGVLVAETVRALFRIMKPESLVELAGALAGRSDISEDIRPVSPIGLVHIGTQAEEFGIATFVLILASTNITLALFNSLPFYPLDGGQFAVAAYEKLTGRRVQVRRLIPIAVAVVAMFAFLGIVAVVLDIVNPLTL